MKELIVDALNENLPEVMSFLDESLEAFGCPLKARMQLDLAVEELFVNVANYAYAPQTGKAEIEIDLAGEIVTIAMKDAGVPYNPFAREDPDTTLSADERQIGGLGVFLVKKNTDAADYRFEDGKNIVTIQKKIF